MSAPWWHDRDLPRPTGGAGDGATEATGRRGDPDEGLVPSGLPVASVAPSPRRPVPSSPATRLRLPPVIRLGATRRVTASPVPAPSRRDCGHGGFVIGTPKDQVGYVKLWRARSADLLPLLFVGAYPAVEYSAPDRPRGEGFRVAEGRAGAEADLAAAMQRSAPADLRGRARDALARRLAAVLQPPAETLLAAAGPLEWPAALFPFQRDGVRALVQSEHLLLGDDMGLGKTIQAVAALRVLLFRREIERALVIAPASLLEQWRRELAIWAPELRVMLVLGSPEDRSWQWQYRAHVTLASYETVRADAAGPRSAPCREAWGAVVLDEAQRIKNRATDAARACKSLPRKRSWALTGTPLENRTEDLLSILEFVTGGGGDGETGRRGDGETGRPEGRGDGATGKTDPLGHPVSPSPRLPVSPSPVLLPRSEYALRRVLGQFQLRRRKADVLQHLPPKIVTELVLPLTPAQRSAYERAERDGLVALRQGGEARVEHVLALITRLKQICNFAPAGEASAKMDDLTGRIEELAAAGQKALVFTQFTGDESGARRIAARLRRFEPLLYTGDMDPWERSRTLQRFQEDARHSVLILSLKAGGQGLNLQRASYVFHFDRWGNPAVERQADDRAHRLGQTQPVNIYRYIMAGTIEERLDALLKSKTELFDNLVDTTTLDLAHFLDKGDLFRLVGLDTPAAGPVHPTGRALEERVAELLRRQGYRVERADPGADGGVDVIAEKTDSVGTRVRLFVQCKETQRPVSVEAVRSLNGVLPPGDRSVTGVVVCPAGFTPEARSFAYARHIQLWDAARLEMLEGER